MLHHQIFFPSLRSWLRVLQMNLPLECMKCRKRIRSWCWERFCFLRGCGRTLGRIGLSCRAEWSAPVCCNTPSTVSPSSLTSVSQYPTSSNILKRHVFSSNRYRQMASSDISVPRQQIFLSRPFSNISTIISGDEVLRNWRAIWWNYFERSQTNVLRGCKMHQKPDIT